MPESLPDPISGSGGTSGKIVKMTEFLVRHFIKDYKDVEKISVRTAYGVLASIVGIFCNVFLFAVKFAVGLVLRSCADMVPKASRRRHQAWGRGGEASRRAPTFRIPECARCRDPAFREARPSWRPAPPRRRWTQRASGRPNDPFPAAARRCRLFRGRRPKGILPQKEGRPWKGGGGGS